MISGPGEIPFRLGPQPRAPMLLPRFSVLTVSVLLAGIVASSGCQSRKAPALSRGTNTSESVGSAAETILAARGQVNVALAALRNLTGRPGDIPRQFKVAQEKIEDLAKSSAKITAAADAMRTKGDAYLADWAKQIAVIGDAELRTAAFDRRAEVAGRLQEIFRSYQRVKSDFEPFQLNLADIQRALGTDLSPKGLEAVKPFVAKAEASALPLKESLGKLADEFRAVGLSLEPRTTTK